MPLVFTTKNTKSTKNRQDRAGKMATTPSHHQASSKKGTLYFVFFVYFVVQSSL